MDIFRLGILYSTGGPYGALGRDCRDGAELAVEHLRRDAGLPFRIETVFGDPACAGGRYLDLAADMLRQGCRHIVGTVTSQSRKDVIPLIEKYDGQLWYVCPYEGFEANESVIYTGACPNQHLLPLFDHLLPTYGRRAYLAGANYVWGWEMNRLARELLLDQGGEVLAERYIPIEETDVDRLIADVAAKRPDFILNNMIGPSSYTFLRAMRALADRDAAFRPERCPIVSCDLTECELGQIGLGVADGHLATASYFDSLDTPDNQPFKAAVAARFGAHRRASSFFAGGYAAVRLCVEAAGACGSDEPAQVRAKVHHTVAPSMLGPLSVDGSTNHAALPFHLGRIAGDGFQVILSRAATAADPYLAAGRRRRAAPRLRLVS